MNIAVCEDDPSQREHIRQICDGYFSGIGQAYQYMEYADGAALLDTEHTGIDLLFLDIELGGAPDGIMVMNVLEKIDAVRKIVFISSHSEAVWDSFGWKTLGFVRKPFQSSEIIHWLEVVRQELYAHRELEFHTEKGTLLIMCNQIEALLAEGNYVRVVTTNDCFFASGALKYWMEKLEGTGIVQVHKSYAVNLEFVAAIHTEIETKTGNQYPVGRTFRKTVIRMYKEFILKRARSRI